MASFVFEKNLEHQEKAVNSAVGVFAESIVESERNRVVSNIANPTIRFRNEGFATNVMRLQNSNKIDNKYSDKKSSIVDISMETGTGKTYTYTKMMFELNKHYKQTKFIVIVPTLAIKAGTVAFLNSSATKEHFRSDYKKELKTYIVESKKSSKGKKEYMPQAIKDFVQVENSKDRIDVLVINQGMLNSPSLEKEYDVRLFDMYSSPFNAISNLNTIAIIDEPHKFKVDNKTWSNIEKLKAQWIFRYGATFDEYKNLIYKLSSVEAFNQNLVKGINAYTMEFNQSENISIKLVQSNSSEATFELNENGKKEQFNIAKNECMSKIHSEMKNLFIENMKKNLVVLSNGLELNTTATINPYSYSQSIQDKMMEDTVANHFELEKKLLNRTPKIKPLSLFFIDDIAGYRDGGANSLKEKFEKIIKAHIEKALETEEDGFYRTYLEKSLEDISLTHGGYFSKDNSGSDEKIQKEIDEILHDKEQLLSLENTRRFIFSKWTLKEGWDNPNVFQICKLRSSGSVTSKLQEVGRGLRLPVNEYMAREKDDNFMLNYFVDFSEKGFVESLVGEINANSETKITYDMKKLSLELQKVILSNYGDFEDENQLCEFLHKEGIVNFALDFVNGGYEKLQSIFPLVIANIDGVRKDRVRNANDKKEKIKIRVQKYEELKALWESINQKAILEYKIENEEQFLNIFCNFLKDCSAQFKESGVENIKRVLGIENSIAYYKKVDSINDNMLEVSYMKYSEFLLELSLSLKMNINTVHKAFCSVKDKFDIKRYLSWQTIRILKFGFDKYLLDNAMTKFKVEYSNISSSIHPTAITNKNGEVLEEIDSSSVGVISGSERVSNAYFFEQLFYDSQLEKDNIVETIDEVIVFTKIPKNSIKIPVAGGGTYSPDFAYVIKDKQKNQTLNLIIETKNKNERDLLIDEKQKIKHSQEFFSKLGGGIKVEFRTQLTNKKIVDFLKEIKNKRV